MRKEKPGSQMDGEQASGASGKIEEAAAGAVETRMCACPSVASYGISTGQADISIKSKGEWCTLRKFE